MWELVIFVAIVVGLIVTWGGRVLGLFGAFRDWDMFTAKKRRAGHGEGGAQPDPPD